MPLFSQDEIFEIWDKIVHKAQIDIDKNVSDKLLKIISMRSNDTGPYKDKYHKIEKISINKLFQIQPFIDPKQEPNPFPINKNK